MNAASPAPLPALRERPSPETVAAVTAALAAQFGNRLVTSQAVREQHGSTLTWVPNQPPDAVVFVDSTEEVQAVVRVCAAHRMPVVAFGTGTSLEGHVNAPYGGVSVDLSGMNRVLAVHAEDLDCVVQPGVTRKALNEHLRDQGLFFPIDPGADASLGGMAATRASGTNAVRYGTMKDNVLALTAVLPNGEILRTGSRARKSSAGYDLTRLLVGSEGTLGIITELTLRLSGIPEAISAGICPFPTIKAACDAVILTIQSGLPVARIELLDEVQVAACNAYSKLSLPETPLLLVEFHGSEASVAEQAERFGEIAAEFDGGPYEWATKAEERSRLWQARHDVYWAASGMRPGAKVIATDVCVPISRLAECVDATKRDIVESGIIAPIAGHVGDGNFHTSPLVMMDDADEIARVTGFIERLVARAIAMEGTCTGEHGIGQKKMRFMEIEHGAPALALMRGLKRTIDPDNIMNPGKVLPL
ncbi:FAD linked oxidase domain protein [Methylobacterium sp. 4-46]|uniref:FAD-binding oxidoreductase n=1 Tax=unclassified Methylobacterium TaxID=2615210 RepID=UPI000165C699|nr:MULTISPECIES: FAD-linked oxidase C-terminal domain-containing protein [Methylobacterium]ACA16499.1 FAD linked oxidase domain protein [Methylobacterium sp. 4-46]WFT83535.1 FAD-linked oxidase C-terminal domain-containing protein [Methylobacterium nodulans]